MRFQDPGGFDPSRDRDGTSLDRFPGPIAVVAGPVDPATVSFGLEEIDDEPWAVEAGYRTPTRYLLTVRTVRSWKHLDPRGLPVEDLTSAVVNFALREAGPARLSRTEIARVPAVPTTIVVDGVETAATRIQVPGCVAIQLGWGEQTVFCAGAPEMADTGR